jgi:hypothetical protein
MSRKEINKTLVWNDKQRLFNECLKRVEIMKKLFTDGDYEGVLEEYEEMHQDYKYMGINYVVDSYAKLHKIAELIDMAYNRPGLPWLGERMKELEEELLAEDKTDEALKLAVARFAAMGLATKFEDDPSETLKTYTGKWIEDRCLAFRELMSL